MTIFRAPPFGIHAVDLALTSPAWWSSTATSPKTSTELHQSVNTSCPTAGQGRAARGRPFDTPTPVGLIIAVVGVEPTLRPSTTALLRTVFEDRWNLAIVPVLPVISTTFIFRLHEEVQQWDIKYAKNTFLFGIRMFSSFLGHPEMTSQFYKFTKRDLRNDVYYVY